MQFISHTKRKIKIDVDKEIFYFLNICVMIKASLIKDSLIKDSLIKNSLIKDNLIKDSLIKDSLIRIFKSRRVYLRIV